MADMKHDMISCNRVVLFTRFIVSYIIILIVPLSLTGFLVYGSFFRILNEEVENATLTALSQTMDNFDMRLKELNNIATQLPQNTNISPLLFTQDLDRLTIYEYYRMVGELKNFRATNTFIDNIFVYLRKMDVVVSADSKYSFSIFYNHVYRPRALSDQDLKSYLNTLQEQETRAAETIYMGSSAREQITYLRPVPITDTSFRATLLVTMDVSAIEKMIGNVLGNYKGNVYLLDDKGNMIHSLQHGSIPLEKDMLFSLMKHESRSVFFQNVEGKKLMVSAVTSDYTGWSCIAVLDADRILAKVNDMKVWTLIVTGLSIIIGVLLAYYFSYHNYHPIRKIADTLYRHSSTGQTTNQVYKNELDMINKVMTTIISKDKALQSSLDQHMPVIRADFLLRILKGYFSSLKAAVEMADFVGVKLEKGPFAVIVFNIDDYDAFAQKNPEPLQGLFRFSVVNVAEELCQPIGRGYTVEVSGDRVVLIIDFDGRNGNFREELQVIGEKAVDFFRTHFEFTLTAGIGLVYSPLMDIPKSYMEAQSAVEYKMVKGSSSVILYDEIMTGTHERYFYSLQHEQRILQSLVQGDYEEIHTILTDIINNIMSSPISINMAQCIYFDIINTAMKSLAELEPEEYNEIIQNNNILPDLLKCETLKEVFEQTASFYKGICQCIRTSRENKVFGFREDVLEYVKKQFSDKNLSLNFLAEKFSVTPSYLSRFFKNHTQRNFIDYLHTVRLGQAKQLLLHSSKSIAEIAEETGYVDSHSIIRAFKKYEGMTPGRFREMYICKNETSPQGMGIKYDESRI